MNSILKIIDANKLTMEETELLNNVLLELENYYINNLNLYNFKGIKIVDDDYLHKDSDGRLEDNTVLLPYTKIKNALSNNFSDEHKKLKGTIYHELAHIDFRNKYPIIHNLYDKMVKAENYDESVPIQIWVEYNTQKASEKFAVESVVRNYFRSVCDYQWNLYNDEHFLILCKHLPYIIVRINGKYIEKEEVLKLIKNVNVRNFILDVEEILSKIDNVQDINNCEFLSELDNFLKSKRSQYLK